jgi:methyl-accepting chemotaxis protein
LRIDNTTPGYADTSSAEEASENVRSISAGTEEMSASVNTIATAMEEMSASIAEVAKNCQTESEVAQNAQEQVNDTSTLMQRLGESAKEIGRIIDTINDIAAKTNLLALNATIEAASAGEAGKGFAVVANEEKELSRQTAKATTDISDKIQNMQNDTTNSIGSMNSIAEVIDQVNSISQTIAAAVEEQSVTSNKIARNLSDSSTTASEIARNVSEIATGITDVSINISTVNSDTHTVADSITAARPQVQQLISLGAELKSVVSTFKVQAAFITWSEEYSVKVPDIDEQHKKLIGLINDLNEAVASGKGRDVVGPVLQSLVDYTVTHFTYEEELLQSVNYPELEKHKPIHKTFVGKMLEFQKDAESGTAMAGTKITLFLKDWLVGHIMNTDKKYGSWVNKHRK